MTAQYYIIKRKLWCQSSIRSIILQSITVWLTDVLVNEWKVHPPHGSILTLARSTPPIHVTPHLPPIPPPSAKAVCHPYNTHSPTPHTKNNHTIANRSTQSIPTNGRHTAEQNKILDNDGAYGSIRRGGVGYVLYWIVWWAWMWAGSKFVPLREWHDKMVSRFWVVPFTLRALFSATGE